MTATLLIMARMSEVVLCSALSLWSASVPVLLLTGAVESQVFDTFELGGATQFGTIPAPDRTSVPTTCPSEVDIAGGYDMEIDLQTGKVTNGDRNINVLEKLNAISENCDIPVVLNVTFDPLGNANINMTRKRLLVDMWFAETQGWVFHIGDSQSNDGNMGDAGHQTHNAELHGKNSLFTVYGSNDDKGQESGILFEKDHFYAKRLTLIVENEQVVWNNYAGHFGLARSPRLFALNGQPDKKKGGVNYNVYVGLNRLVGAAHKSGMGLCRAAFKWFPYLT